MSGGPNLFPNVKFISMEILINNIAFVEVNYCAAFDSFLFLPVPLLNFPAAIVM